MRFLIVNVNYYLLKIKYFFVDLFSSICNYLKVNHIKKNDLQDDFVEYSHNEKEFNEFVIKVIVTFFLLISFLIFLCSSTALHLIDTIFVKTTNISNYFFNTVDFMFSFIYNTKSIIIEYFESNSYFFIFFLFFFYFFNVFFLSIATFFFGVRGVFIVSFVSILLFWSMQFYFLKDFFFKSVVYYLNFDFLNFFIGSISFSFSFKLDFLNFSFLFLTTSIGLCAIVYSLSYFKNEPNADRFILLLNWFIISMSFLVICDNALLLFLGWELIGLTSFLLINFWTVRRGTLKSAVKAFTFNKISDVLLLFFIIILSHQTATLNLSTWHAFFVIKDFDNSSYLNVPGFFLIAASSIKSAQIFGHLWLPDSMEAPIPASALIHSATLVSAGVFLLLKFNWIIDSNLLSFVIFVLGSVTALYGAVVSAAQTDCKKLLAYSTISHCGFLFVTISINNLYLTITYLYLHGFFKALTFFCVGNLVKVAKGYQDTRKMGQLFLILPIESILLLFCAINLGALPFTVGYFYKFLLQSFFLNMSSTVFFYPFLLLAMLASVVYVYRLVFYSLFDVQKNNDLVYNYYFKKNYNNYYHSNSTILASLFIFLLTTFCIFLVNVYVLFFRDFLIYNFNCDYEYSELKFMFTDININYLLFFYSFFTSLVLLLINIECRYNFNYLIKLDFMLWVFCVFFVSQFSIIIYPYIYFF